MTSQRDLRIDFFRGLALLIVVVDHIEGWSGESVLKSWTLISLGFSDAAEIFVFLSGYVFAVAYSRTLDRYGLFACLKKAVKRSVQIYVAYLLAAWTVIGIGAMFIDWNPPHGDGLRIGQRAWESALASLTFRFQPYGFPILAFYVLVLPVMSLMLYLCRHLAWVAWSMSAGAYLAARMFPDLNFHRFADCDQWYFNLLAWQFLFFIGVCLGGTPRRQALLVPRTLLVILSVGVVALGFFAVKATPLLIHWDPRLADTLNPLQSLCWSWAGKPRLDPLRLVHFFALAYLTAQVASRQLAFWSSRIARPIVVCGQQALEVYAWGLVVSFVGAFILASFHESTLAVLIADLDGCLLSIGFAFCIMWWKGQGAATTAIANFEAEPPE
jgi:hypothetical protein